MTYDLAGETLLPRHDRECGHPFLRPAEECEVCDIDWLLETGWAEDAVELAALRADLLREVSHG